VKSVTELGPKIPGSLKMSGQIEMNGAVNENSGTSAAITTINSRVENYRRHEHDEHAGGSDVTRCVVTMATMVHQQVLGA